jgi:hypothetical protein
VRADDQILMVGLVAAIVMLFGGLARWTGMTSRRQDLALLIGAVVLLVVVFAGLILLALIDTIDPPAHT